jgi:hypothetical protein
MKDGRTHLAHKAEHAVDLETGAIVGVTVQDADHGDTTTIAETVTTAAEDLEAVATVTDEHTAVIEEDLVACDFRRQYPESSPASQFQLVTTHEFVATFFRLRVTIDDKHCRDDYDCEVHQSADAHRDWLDTE